MDFSSPWLQTLLPAAKKLLIKGAQAPFWVKLSSLLGILLISWLTTCQIALNRYLQIQTLAPQISVLVRRAEALEKQRALHKKMKEQIGRASRDYLNQTLETMPLLQGESHRVRALLKQFPDNLSLKERLLFLKSDQNKIVFERQGESSKQEIELHLTHRVQMDLNDLRKFLEAVEGDRYDASQGKPFLLVKKFDLLKCYEKGDEKVYSIDISLLDLLEKL